MPRKDLTLGDFKKTVPPGGLLNRGLRTINTNVKAIKPMKKPKGDFKSIGY